MNSPVETLTNRRLDWSWSVTELKAIFQTLFVKVFFCRQLNKPNSRSLLDFFRIDRFPFSVAMEAPPHVYAEAQLVGFVERGVLQDRKYSLIF